MNQPFLFRSAINFWDSSFTITSTCCKTSFSNSSFNLWSIEYFSASVDSSILYNTQNITKNSLSYILHTSLEETNFQLYIIKLQTPYKQIPLKQNVNFLVKSVKIYIKQYIV